MSARKITFSFKLMLIIYKVNLLTLNLAIVCDDFDPVVNKFLRHFNATRYFFGGENTNLVAVKIQNDRIQAASE